MMNQYLIVYGNMQKRTVYYKERPLDDYHFYNGKILDKIRVVQYPSYFEAGTSISQVYDSLNHDKLIPASERNDGIIFKRDLKIAIKKGTRDGIFFDSCYNFITCISGYVFINVTNMIQGTENYLKSESFVISTDNPIQILIPPFYGFSYKALEDTVMFDKIAFKSEDTLIQKKIDIDKIKIEWP